VFAGTKITGNIYLYIIEKFTLLQWKEGEEEVVKQNTASPHNNIIHAALNVRFPGWWIGWESPVT
jgi:hypothetical protein